MKHWLLTGNLPYAATALLCAACFALGTQLARSPARIVVAERGAVVLEAVLDMPGASKEELQARIEAPTRAVLQRYRDQGYLVIDTSRDEAGHLLVAALPSTVADITAELRAAVRRSDPAPAASQGTPP